MKQLRQELSEHFVNIDPPDRYTTHMWAFVRHAATQVEDLVDDVNLADTTFGEVLRYYGEDDKNMTSSEFFGIFKTFITSYKVRNLYIYSAMQAAQRQSEMPFRQHDSG